MERLSPGAALLWGLAGTKADPGRDQYIRSFHLMLGLCKPDTQRAVREENLSRSRQPEGPHVGANVERRYHQQGYRS